MTVDAVFTALADPTRRQIVEWLAAGSEATATSLATRLPISRQAVAKHLAELAAAGVVTARRQGKEVKYSLRVEPLTAASDWIAARADEWDRRLAALADHIASKAID